MIVTTQIVTFNQIVTLTQKVTSFWPHENVTIMSGDSNLNRNYQGDYFERVFSPSESSWSDLFRIEPFPELTLFLNWLSSRKDPFSKRQISLSDP